MLSQFQRGALYALPVGARPLMLYYDAAYFRREGVAPVNSNWDWNDLVVNAAELTKRKADGTVVRWGLATHSVGLWWALWQNEADVVDLGTLQCRLQEPGAIEALQFFRDLLHTHRVSPVLYRDLFELIHQSGNPPAMVYELSPRRPFHGDFRLAELPRGKVRAVPVYADMGIAIAARTANPEAAYTALKGLAHVMQTARECAYPKRSGSKAWGIAQGPSPGRGDCITAVYGAWTRLAADRGAIWRHPLSS